MLHFRIGSKNMAINRKFWGIDTDAVCRLSRQEMREYITEVIQKCSGHGGFAFSSGNSIPDYVPVEGYLNMIEIVRELRGDFKI